MSRSDEVLPQVAVGAVVIRDNSVLLIRRANPPMAGLWSIPGGRVKPGETLQQAAERELLEETGIQAQASEPIHCFDLIETAPDGGLRFHYVIIDVLADYVAGELRAGDDALEAAWVARDKLADLAVNRTTREFLQRLFEF
jgi:ADP-ribose pyrophosphatase